MAMLDTSPDEVLPAVHGTGDSTGTAYLDRTWWSWAGPHGGVLAGLLLQAAAKLAGDRVPRALSVQFLVPPAQGRLDLTAQVLREGGSSSVVRAELRSPDGPLAATAVLTSARSRAGTGSYDVVPAPVVPGPQNCPPFAPPVEFVPFSSHVQYRIVGAVPLSGSPTAELTAWVRTRVQQPYDAAALVVLTDVMPPALYGATSTLVPVPTVSLDVVLQDVPPASGWVLARIATRTAAGGWCVDDCEVWDHDGRLLAQARQVRRVLGELELS